MLCFLIFAVFGLLNEVNAIVDSTDYSRDIIIIDENANSVYKFKYLISNLDFDTYIPEFDINFLVPKDVSGLMFYYNDLNFSGGIIRNNILDSNINLVASDYNAIDIYTLTVLPLYFGTVEMGYSYNLPQNTVTRSENNYYFNYPVDLFNYNDLIICVPESAVISKSELPASYYLNTFEKCPEGYIGLYNYRLNKYNELNFNFKIPGKFVNSLSYNIENLIVTSPEDYKDRLLTNIGDLNSLINYLYTDFNLNTKDFINVNFVSPNDISKDKDIAFTDNRSIDYSLSILGSDDVYLKANILYGLISGILYSDYNLDSTKDIWLFKGLTMKLTNLLLSKEQQYKSVLNQQLNYYDEIKNMDYNEFNVALQNSKDIDDSIIYSFILETIEESCPNFSSKVLKLLKDNDDLILTDQKQINNFILYNSQELCENNNILFIFDKYKLDHDNVLELVKNYKLLNLNYLSLSINSKIDIYDSVFQQLEYINYNLERGNCSDMDILLTKLNTQFIDFNKLNVLVTTVENKYFETSGFWFFPKIMTGHHLNLIKENIMYLDLSGINKELQSAQYWINNSILFGILSYLGILILLGLVVVLVLKFKIFNEFKGHKKYKY